MLELVGELEADRNTHKHPEPRLLGHECAHCASPLVLVLLGGNTADLCVVGSPKPTPFGKRLGKYSL